LSSLPDICIKKPEKRQQINFSTSKTPKNKGFTAVVPGLAVFPQTTLHILASEASKSVTLYRWHHHLPL
jgi:hypothetical protein